MTQVAKGTLAVTLRPMEFEGVVPELKLGRLSSDKQIAGNLVATAKGQILSAGTGVKGSAG